MRERTPEEIAAFKAAVIKHLALIEGVLDGTGEHVDHTRKQIGRCVYCSCGVRAQGRMK